MTIKRSREEMELERTIAMANYLVLLSRAPHSAPLARVYECKTCNRQFPSFQALGGHRASHKKPKLSADPDHHTVIDHDRMDENARKPKTHECSICGLEFPIGQALGGHMRRHRAALTGSSHLPNLSLSLDTSSSNDVEEFRSNDVKTSTFGDNHQGIVCLDLNLTPMENGLLEFGNIAPVVC
ncbi:Zinc finger protein ZAT8 [Bienertia sinuspersici]